MMSDEENKVIECCICGKDTDKLEQFNGEQMCDVCYNDPDNQIF